MRKFNKAIFFGSNTPDPMAQCYELHRRLEDAIQYVSGLQQPPHTEEGMEQDRRTERELNDAVTDILVALGFVDIAKNIR